VQLLRGVEVFAAGLVGTVHQVDQFRVGLQEKPGTGVAARRRRSLRPQRCVEQQRVAPAEGPGRIGVRGGRHPAWLVRVEEPGDGFRRQPGLVHERHQHVVFVARAI
jgi:hypothetical protein